MTIVFAKQLALAIVATVCIVGTALLVSGIPVLAFLFVYFALNGLLTKRIVEWIYRFTMPKAKAKAQRANLVRLTYK